MTITDAAAILGLVSGVAGTVLGVLNYLRDRAAVVVGLQWDMRVTPGSGYDPNKKWGFITVTNVGRRAIYVSHVALRMYDNRFGISHLVLMDGIVGKTLNEASPSATHVVDQDGLQEYASAWHLIRAQVSDQTGKVWISKYVSEKPSWAEVEPG